MSPDASCESDAGHAGMTKISIFVFCRASVDHESVRGGTCFSFQVCGFVMLGKARKKLQRVKLLHGHALVGVESIIFFPMIHFLLQPLPIDER